MAVTERVSRAVGVAILVTITVIIVCISLTATSFTQSKSSLLSRDVEIFQVERSHPAAVTIQDHNGLFVADTGSSKTLVSRKLAAQWGLNPTTRSLTKTYKGGSATCHLSDGPTRLLGQDKPVWICDTGRMHALTVGADGIIGLSMSDADAAESMDETARAPRRYTYSKADARLCVGAGCPRIVSKNSKNCGPMYVGDSKLNGKIEFPTFAGSVADTGTTTTQTGILGMDKLRALDVDQSAQGGVACVASE